MQFIVGDGMDNVIANHRVELWGNVKAENELMEESNKPTKIRSLWADIIPQTGSLGKRENGTLLSTVTHKLIVPYLSGKDIASDMWFEYKDHRFEIRYILNPLFSNEVLEFFLEEVIE